MRVIGGTYKRRTLARLPRGMRNVRPTYDPIRENAFNLLGAKVSGARFLDLFAGTGSVGLEALSRNAAFAAFVDTSSECAALIRRNCETLKIAPDRYKILISDAPDYVRRAKGEKYDIVFLDPPYDDKLLEETLQLLGESELLKNDSTVIAQHAKGQAADSSTTLLCARRVRYGKSWLSLWKPPQNREEQ